MASFAARSALRSAGRVASGSKLAGGAAKTKPSSSPFQIPKQAQNRLSGPSSLRSAMETSRCLGSMLPYHSATATALLNSMLSLSNPIFSSLPEGK